MSRPKLAARRSGRRVPWLPFVVVACVSLPALAAESSRSADSSNPWDVDLGRDCTNDTACSRLHLDHWDRPTCMARVQARQRREAGFHELYETNRLYFARLDDGTILNTSSTMTLTLLGCDTFCGAGTWYWDAIPRLTTWIIPVVLLLSNIELSPIDKHRFMTVVHAVGDPIDSFWSLLHKIYVWRRLHAMGLDRCDPRVRGQSWRAYATERWMSRRRRWARWWRRFLTHAVHRLQRWTVALRGRPTGRQQLPPKTGPQHEQGGAHDVADGDATRQQQPPDGNDLHKLRDEVDDDEEFGRAHDRARVIATVLAGFEEISGAYIETELHYAMVLDRLGNIGRKGTQVEAAWHEWRHCARMLADARTNEFLRTLLAIFVYIFGVLAALDDAVGGGNTSKPGGRIGSAVFLMWLVPLALLSNVVGTFTSRRTCLTIMRQFVEKAKKAVEDDERRKSEEATRNIQAKGKGKEEKPRINSDDQVAPGTTEHDASTLPSDHPAAMSGGSGVVGDELPSPALKTGGPSPSGAEDGSLSPTTLPQQGGANLAAGAATSGAKAKRPEDLLLNAQPGKKNKAALHAQQRPSPARSGRAGSEGGGGHVKVKDKDGQVFELLPTAASAGDVLAKQGQASRDYLSADVDPRDNYFAGSVGGSSPGTTPGQAATASASGSRAALVDSSWPNFGAFSFGESKAGPSTAATTVGSGVSPSPQPRGGGGKAASSSGGQPTGAHAQRRPLSDDDDDDDDDDDTTEKLIRIDRWAEYFSSLHWLGAVYTYRPWKIGYRAVHRKSHAHYAPNWLLYLLAVFPVVVSAAGAFIIIWFAVPVGWSCRHVWVVGLTVAWFVSNTITIWLHNDRISARVHDDPAGGSNGSTGLHPDASPQSPPNLRPGPDPSPSANPTPSPDPSPSVGPAAPEIGRPDGKSPEITVIDATASDNGATKSADNIQPTSAWRRPWQLLWRLVVRPAWRWFLGPRPGRWSEKWRWYCVLAKDAIVGLGGLAVVFLSTSGIFNNCYCWSALMWYSLIWHDPSRAVVPLNTEDEYSLRADEVYGRVVWTALGLQLVFFFGVVFTWWDGVSVVRWNESRRRREWRHEMEPDNDGGPSAVVGAGPRPRDDGEIRTDLADIKNDDAGYLLFWYNKDEFESQKSANRVRQNTFTQEQMERQTERRRSSAGAPRARRRSFISGNAPERTRTGLVELGEKRKT